MPLVVAYARGIAFEREAARQLKANPDEGKYVVAWERAIKVLVALTRQAASYVRKAVNIRKRPRECSLKVPKPWAEP